jgi:hypothetical protein
LTAILLLALPRAADAVYLDEEQNISLRGRFYSQASIRLENSRGDTTPTTKAGQLVQHRNFYNPELDADLTSYLRWMKGGSVDWLAPDRFTFRAAGWGFYDGIYDYGSSQFSRSASLINSTFSDLESDPTNAWFLEGDTFNPCPRGGGCSLQEIFGDDFDVQKPRAIYGTRHRINELYLSYGNGPLFVRLGRQAISWGESDTIALLDQNNPFDITLAAPGLFMDLDEARIPLWTLRVSYDLFDRLGPFSSTFVEAYWVPGDIDVNTGTVPILTASPYSSPGVDPQGIVSDLNDQGINIPAQFVLLDETPKKSFENSRWGVRLQTVIGLEHTFSAWFYTHFPNQPAPVARGLVRTDTGRQLFVTSTIHDLTSVFGIADTFFLEPIDSIIRLEAEYFDNEPGFVPERNMGITGDPIAVLTGCTIRPGRPAPCGAPKADFLRWEVGLDRFFFFRPLNPTNSFTMIAAIVGSWNISETSLNDYKYGGVRKPGGQGTSAEDFVDLKTVEAFGQLTLQTDYWHGRLQPRLTLIQNVRGTYVIQPALTYRWSDWLLFGLDFIHIGGAFQQAGFFRDRDQATVRVTYQLN